MDYAAYQLKRREWSEKEKAERSIHWDQARAGLQASVTEQGIRELFAKYAELDARLAVIEAKRGPGRPPKEAE